MDNHLENLMWRYATKKFDSSKKLSVAETDMLEEALRLAPNSIGLQAWRFYRIDDPKIRVAVREAGHDQPQITDASHIYALASKVAITKEDVVEFIESTKSVRGVDEEAVAGYRKNLEDRFAAMPPKDAEQWARCQVYIALGFILDAAAQHKIDACPMEGFDSVKVSQIVGADKDGYAVRTLCAVGHRASDDKSALLKKVRYPKEKVLKII